MKFTQFVVVREPIKSNLIALRGDVNVEVKVCCCFSQGVIKI